MNTGVLKKGIATCFTFLALAIIARSETFEETKAKAEKGDAVAQYNLGACYILSKGVKMDKAESFKWFRKSADQGYADAQLYVGVCYENGSSGVATNKAEAVNWYRKSAEQGNAMAQMALGTCYVLGKGVKKDEAEALKWLRKAAASSDATASSSAKDYIREIKSLMAEDEQLAEDAQAEKETGSSVNTNLLAAEKKLPDLAKVFPDEVLFTQTKIGTIETYGYMTDRSFSDLKSILQLYLGNGWIEEKQDAQDTVFEKAANKQMKDQGMIFVGNLLFSNSAYPDINIGFTMVEMNMSGKKYLANITVLRRDAEHAPAAGRGETPRP